MVVSSQKFRVNMSKYLALADTEDIVITKNDEPIAKIIGTKKNRVEMAKSLFGIIPNNITLEEARLERLTRRQ